MLLDENNHKIDSSKMQPDQIILKNPSSPICAMNIGEFYFHNDNHENA